MRPVVRHVAVKVVIEAVHVARIGRVDAGRDAPVVALVARQRLLVALDRLVLGAVLRHRLGALFVVRVAAVDTSIAKGVMLEVELNT